MLTFNKKMTDFPNNSYRLLIIPQCATKFPPHHMVWSEACGLEITGYNELIW